MKEMRIDEDEVQVAKEEIHEDEMGPGDMSLEANVETKNMVWMILNQVIVTQELGSLSDLIKLN